MGRTRIRDTYRCETCGFLCDAGRHVDGSVKGCRLTAQGLTNPQNVGALYADMEEQVKEFEKLLDTLAVAGDAEAAIDELQRRVGEEERTRDAFRDTSTY